jgi:tRNA-dihydrouridine synthase
MKTPQLIYDIVYAVVNSVKTPITVKIRSGWDKKNINCVEVAKLIEKAGASAIIIHPRTRDEGFSGMSN